MAKSSADLNSGSQMGPATRWSHESTDKGSLAMLPLSKRLAILVPRDGLEPDATPRKNGARSRPDFNWGRDILYCTSSIGSPTIIIRETERSSILIAILLRPSQLFLASF